jgi:hypothetical protein
MVYLSLSSVSLSVSFLMSSSWLLIFSSIFLIIKFLSPRIDYTSFISFWNEFIYYYFLVIIIWYFQDHTIETTNFLEMLECTDIDLQYHQPLSSPSFCFYAFAFLGVFYQLFPPHWFGSWCCHRRKLLIIGVLLAYTNKLCLPLGFIMECRFCWGIWQRCIHCVMGGFS